LPDEVRQLVKRCLAGEQPAMLELVERFQGQVFGLCYRMLGHRQDAEDMAQESFVRALRSLAGWDAEREFAPWLLAIAANRCRSLLGVRMNRPRAGPLVEELPDRRPDPRGESSLSEEVDLALGRIREEYRRAFLLFHEQEMSYADIAVALDCPLGTVKTWVHRARRELARLLAERGVALESNDAMRGI
jgi:RNA polymerase sigma-70 factor (ECF subfamily)